MFSGVCVQGMWNSQVKDQVTEMHRLKVNSHCDTALFIDTDSFIDTLILWNSKDCEAV